MCRSGPGRRIVEESREAGVHMELLNGLEPDFEAAELIIPPPEPGRGNWAGAPSAWFADGWFYLAYRLRRGINDRGFSAVVARSTDGTAFETLLELEKAEFGAASLERPALVRSPDRTWRLYVSCATPGNFHWWVDVLSAADPAHFDPGQRMRVLPGDEATAIKDPVVTVDGDQWMLWASCHPLDDAQATDRMSSRYATSTDGMRWIFVGDALQEPSGGWDQRGTRVSYARRTDAGWLALYDGRATAAENAEERTGVAVGPNPFALRAVGNGAVYGSPWGSGSLRYISVVDGPEGRPERMYFEACLQDGSHGLFTQDLRPG